VMYIQPSFKNGHASLNRNPKSFPTLSLLQQLRKNWFTVPLRKSH
jgi:hypothetical protein